MGVDELGGDPELATNAGRLANRSRIIDALAKRLKEKNAAEWIELLDAAGVPCGVVKSVLEALSAVEMSPLSGIAPVAGQVRLPPPMLDEHGEEIRALGWKAFSRD